MLEQEKSGLDKTIQDIADKAGVSFDKAKEKFKEIEKEIEDSDVENVFAVAISTLKKAFEVEEQSVNNLGKTPSPGTTPDRKKKSKKKNKSKASRIIQLLDK